MLILLSEAKEPAFLQKLRGQYGNTNGRLERPVARPRKLKDGKDDDDDEPVYVDEESNEVISKEDYQALVGGSVSQKEDEVTSKDQSTVKVEDNDKAHPMTDTTITKQRNLTEVGGQRKRKQAKIVGEDKPDIEQKKLEAEETQPKAPTPRKVQKAKKIKLSFDEE